MSILAYDNSFVNVFKIEYNRDITNVTDGINIPKYMLSEDKSKYIQNIDCPYCKYLDESNIVHHSFTVGEISTRKNEIKKKHDKNIIENAGFEVYNNRFNYNTGGYDNFLKIEQGTRTEYETNTTTAPPTTTEEPTSDDSEATKETTTPDVEVPTTTEPEAEVPTTTSSPEPATSDRVVVIPTSSNSTTKPEVTTTKKPEPTTTVKRGTSSIKKSKLNIPANIKAKNIKKKAIKLTWRKTLNAKKYQVQYSTKSNFKKSVTKTTTKLKYIIKKLKKGKTYYIRLRVVNGKKISNWSKVKKIKIKK